MKSGLEKSGLSEFKGHADQKYGHISYSHCGEDIMVANLFDLMGIKNPSYLDIGAHHPFNISNTALLYSRGSRGVNVEANPKLMQAFHEMRPEDKNINIGIALQPGVIDFYMWDDRSGRNTFNPEWAKKLEQHTETIKLPVTTLKHVVDEHCNGLFPDFFTIDIEGMDILVLEHADFRMSSPKVICVEAWKQDAPAFKRILDEKGYFLYSRHSMDLIFVRRDYKDLIY